jgi:hypothetical protein
MWNNQSWSRKTIESLATAARLSLRGFPASSGPGPLPGLGSAIQLSQPQPEKACQRIGS